MLFATGLKRTGRLNFKSEVKMSDRYKFTKQEWDIIGGWGEVPAERQLVPDPAEVFTGKAAGVAPAVCLEEANKPPRKVEKLTDAELTRIGCLRPF